MARMRVDSDATSYTAVDVAQGLAAPKSHPSPVAFDRSADAHPDDLTRTPTPTPPPGPRQARSPKPALRISTLVAMYQSDEPSAASPAAAATMASGSAEGGERRRSHTDGPDNGADDAQRRHAALADMIFLEPPSLSRSAVRRSLLAADDEGVRRTPSPSPVRAIRPVPSDASLNASSGFFVREGEGEG